MFHVAYAVSGGIKKKKNKKMSEIMARGAASLTSIFITRGKSELIN